MSKQQIVSKKMVEKAIALLKTPKGASDFKKALSRLK